ncbi:DnaJ domain-containing protein [Rhizobium sp. RU20A]|uniref:J domain-containing protein n=1 Tax=Rhizobium sp. RU20A TaxID=1907412 RepID=UPI0009550D8A|nr:J domain-containing protein [Rhizobium sp. RU20A]SIQ14917.1 DnaJ domain-containing protein [Rhizobium sp. RU20A]
MIDPYETLGVARDAGEAEIRAAFRQAAKSAHPDQGGDAEAFAQLSAAHELLKDPVRRKVFDDTGYDPDMADPKALKGLMMLEALVNEMILDERMPGSFDPVAAMRRKLSDDILKNRFHILELERHRDRVRHHIDRLARRPGTDVLGSMLRARSQSITDAIRSTEQQIAAIEQAYGMLDGYAYELDARDPPPPAPPQDAYDIRQEAPAVVSEPRGDVVKAAE